VAADVATTCAARCRRVIGWQVAACRVDSAAAARSGVVVSGDPTMRVISASTPSLLAIERSVAEPHQGEEDVIGSFDVGDAAGAIVQKDQIG
jgi:hypothetical protein